MNYFKASIARRFRIFTINTDHFSSPWHLGLTMLRILRSLPDPAAKRGLTSQDNLENAKRPKGTKSKHNVNWDLFPFKKSLFPS